MLIVPRSNSQSHHQFCEAGPSRRHERGPTRNSEPANIRVRIMYVRGAKSGIPECSLRLCTLIIRAEDPDTFKTEMRAGSGVRKRVYLLQLN